MDPQENIQEGDPVDVTANSGQQPQASQRARQVRIQDHIDAANRIQATLGLIPQSNRGEDSAQGEVASITQNITGQTRTRTNLEQLRQVQQETQQILAQVNSGGGASTVRAQPGGSTLQRAPSSVLHTNSQEEAKTRNQADDVASPFTHPSQARSANQTATANRQGGNLDFQAILQQNQTRIAAQARNARNNEISYSLSEREANQSQRIRSFGTSNLNGINSTNFTTQAMTTTSTQRENQEQNTQWPPVDLYTQIDALISNSNAPARGEEMDNQTILQTILRQATNRTANVATSQQQILDQINATNQQMQVDGEHPRRRSEDSNSQSTVNEEQMNEMQTGNSSMEESSEPEEQGESDHGRHHQVAIDQMRQREFQRLRELRAANDSPDGAENDQDAEIDEIANLMIDGVEEASSSHSSPEQRFRVQSDQAAALPSSSDEEEEDSNTSNEGNVESLHSQMGLNLRTLGLGSGDPMAQLNRMTSNQGYGSQAYPQQDDIDDNDEVVSSSMSDSIGAIVSGTLGTGSRGPQSRIADIGTIQSANTRRVVESNVSRHQHRHQREEQKTSANQNLEELFKCFICFSKIEDAVICPSCSKLCCKDCMRKWLIEQRQQCPHCRGPLQVHQLVSCSRFVKEITEHIDVLNAAQPGTGRDGEQMNSDTILRDGAEVCKEHGARLDYYCQTCKTPICSDCAMFGGDKHKDHKFLRLAEVYEKHCEVIKKEAIGLKKRLKELNKHMNDVQSTIEKVTKAKEDKCKEIDNFVENIQAKLNQQLKNKLLTLLSQRGSMQDEIEQLEEFHTKLNLELTKMPKSSLIKKSGDLIRQLKEIHTKEPHRFVDNEVSIDFTSELVPQYEQSIFVIKNFSRIRSSESEAADENEIVYSDPPLVTRSGLTWRLKVYPNGNGIAKGNYISVFLEMLKGLPDTQTQKYEYRVEMINHRNPGAQVVREFASDFEVGECWGYNRFYRIDLLDREGYLNQADDSITLKFFVRAPYYSQHCGDQERHIINLQKVIDKQNKDLEELKEKYHESQKKLKKNASKVKKLKAVSDNDPCTPEEELSEIKEVDENQRASQLLLYQLKEKQRKNELKVSQNNQQIQQVIFRKRKNEESKKSSSGPKQVEEEKKETIQPRVSKPENQTKFSIQVYNEEKKSQQRHKNTLLANFEQSDEGRENSPGDKIISNSSSRQRKVSSQNDSLENDNSSNEQKPYQKNKYMNYKSEDHYEPVENSDEKKMDTSMSNGSQNEEEIKEQHQYQILKQSLRALQERASTTFNQPASVKQEDHRDEDLAKNYSISDENEFQKAQEDHSDTDAIANDGQPYPQGLISDDSNELIVMSPPRDQAHEKSDSSNSQHHDSLQVEDINPVDEVDQSYVQSSLDGGDISTNNIKEDMFNISHVEEQKNPFRHDILEQAISNSLQLEQKANEPMFKKFQIKGSQTRGAPEEEKTSSSQILTSINEKVMEKRKQQHLRPQNSQGKVSLQMIQQTKVKLQSSHSAAKMDSGPSANQKLLAQLKQKRMSQIKENKNKD